MTTNFLTRAFRCYLMATGLCLVAVVVITPKTVMGQGTFEGPTIDYLNAKVDDAVVQLMARIEAGETKLIHDKEHGYLKSLLSELDIPVDSQTLVFSKTSLQLQRITPRRPRALYFNDDVYVGYCQNGDVLEIAATDAKQGATFYTLEQDVDEAPSFIRDRGQCLTCHASSRTQNVPGYLVRSVFANKMGHPILGSGTHTTDHQSPFDERWGGWYVTGEHGKMQHMGNKLFNDKDRQHDLSAGLNLTSLDGLVSTAPYLSPHSDIVALMVLEHQTQVHNAMIAANYETREALHQCFEMNRFLEREPGFISDSANRRIDAVTENLVEHLLMCDEFALQDTVRGTSGFSETFEQRGPRDSQGRSLRELELTSRLFRYRCSFLIHSPSFDGLPDEVRQRVVKRMLDILEGRDASPKFAHVAADEKQAILEILRETKPEFRG